MAKVLELVFRNATGSEATISLPNPKADLTAAAATAVMNDVIAKDLFLTKGGALTQVVEARVRVTDVTALV